MFETTSSFFESFHQFLSSVLGFFGKKNLKIIKIFFIAMCFFLGLGGVLYGLVGLIHTTDTEILSCPDISESDTTNSDGVASRGCLPWGRVFVDVSGAVNDPGVYQLTTGSRISDAIEMAQGFSAVADKNFVHLKLNLAQQINDGDKVYIPFEGEDNASQENKATSQILSGEEEVVKDQTQKVSLNQATQEDLESLPDIGEKRAQEIIQNRPYLSIDELSTEEIVGEALFEKIVDLIQL
jgi:competence protein ComEA